MGTLYLLKIHGLIAERMSFCCLFVQQFHHHISALRSGGASLRVESVGRERSPASLSAHNALADSPVECFRRPAADLGAIGILIDQSIRML